MHLARFGTYGRGVWDFVVDQARNSVASDSVCVTAPTFNLSAKPSLFSTRTDISFELSEAGNITLRIYDITGKAVRTIVSDRLDSGWHHYDWKGTSDSGMLLPSGYYTCIAAGIGKVEFAKIDLVR
ncbi:MAG: FlgD immunoglobulin-like domain containing protein [bacterium]